MAKYAKLAAQKVQQAKDRATAAERRYQEIQAEDYGKTPARDGARVLPTRELRVGDWVLVKRRPVGTWGLKAAGPLVVIAIEKNKVCLRSLLTGRESWETPENCKLWGAK